MREIKFRGREQDGFWTYGDLRHDDNITGIIENGVYSWVDPSTVGQFTGLTDSTGKEIYEGDILSLREGSDEEIKVIDFYAAITALDLPAMMNLRGLDYYFERGEVHVIGNVHDNPELLEVEA